MLQTETSEHVLGKLYFTGNIDIYPFFRMDAFITRAPPFDRLLSLLLHEGSLAVPTPFQIVRARRLIKTRWVRFWGNIRFTHKRNHANRAVWSTRIYLGLFNRNTGIH